MLPIVMNTKEQITADMAANGVETPSLLDDGTLSDTYGTMGNGCRNRHDRLADIYMKVS